MLKVNEMRLICKHWLKRLKCRERANKRSCKRLHLFFQLVVNAKMSLKMAFYNEKLSVWEYLVEPVLENERIKMWNLDLQVESQF